MASFGGVEILNLFGLRLNWTRYHFFIQDTRMVFLSFPFCKGFRQVNSGKLPLVLCTTAVGHLVVGWETSFTQNILGWHKRSAVTYLKCAKVTKWPASNVWGSEWGHESVFTLRCRWGRWRCRLRRGGWTCTPSNEAPHHHLGKYNITKKENRELYWIVL